MSQESLEKCVRVRPNAYSWTPEEVLVFQMNPDRCTQCTVVSSYCGEAQTQAQRGGVRKKAFCARARPV